MSLSEKTLLTGFFGSSPCTLHWDYLQLLCQSFFSNFLFLISFEFLLKTIATKSYLLFPELFEIHFTEVMAQIRQGPWFPFLTTTVIFTPEFLSPTSPASSFLLGRIKPRIISPIVYLFPLIWRVKMLNQLSPLDQILCVLSSPPQVLLAFASLPLYSGLWESCVLILSGFRIYRVLPSSVSFPNPSY